MQKKYKIDPKKLPEYKGDTVPPASTLDLMPISLIKEFQAFIFEKDGEKIKIAVVDPYNRELMGYAEKKFGNNFELFKAKKSDIDLIAGNYIRDFRAEIEDLVRPGTRNDANIINIVDCIIAFAIAEKASDVHIEPLREKTIIRFRIDGMLHTMLSLPHEIHTTLIARLKILANMKIDEYRRAQDGRIEPENTPNTSLRVSVIPMLFGEKAVFRILNDTGNRLSITDLGFLERHQNILERNTEKPFGMIITSGPTGSGKTTTLYGLIGTLQREGINISTLEDPVEHTLEGVNQIQINPRFDLTFASGLRSLLRQDPDIIMIGEVRDSETAVMAANAALTGHLVLTTMHTNDAASAFTRILEMKVEDFVVGSTINMVIAQRLVRKVCNACAAERQIDEAVFKKIEERQDVRAVLEEKKISLAELKKKKFRMGMGCKSCTGTGYFGRVGMFEILEPNKEIHDLILAHASTDQIKAAAKKDGFCEMLHDGIEKIFLGWTTFEEVLRTTRNV